MGLTRSMLYGIRIIERVAARGAMLKALDRQWLDLTTPLGKGILAASWTACVIVLLYVFAARCARIAGALGRVR